MTIRYGSKELSKDYGELTFGKALESHRLCEGLTQKEFAKQLGISPASLCDLEKGRRIPSVGRAVKIAGIIGTPNQTWIQLAMQDALKKENLNYSVRLDSQPVHV